MVFTVKEDGELLTFLLAAMPKLSRNSVKHLLKNKEVLVDGRHVTQFNQRLSPGQNVSVRSERNSGGKPSFIIYEDDEIIAIDKPAGLLSIATDNEKANTAYHMLTEYVKPRRIFIVHRLDKDTSGVLIFAKSEEVKHNLQDNWEKIILTRGYAAIVAGKPESPRGVIKSYLLETKTHLMYSSKTPGDGQEAITEYRVLKTSKAFSLLDIRLLTGRKNQIRVHMKELGFPIIGDKKYGATLNPLGRLALHAHLLEFTHPTTGKLMRFESPVPPEFTRMFSQK